MSRLDEVFEALHDVILERFRAEQGGDAGSAFVAFEFGTPIPDDTFRLNDPARTLSPELAVQFLSQHANTVPEVKGMLFRRRPYTVDEQYGLMLMGAMPADASSMDLLGAVKGEAAEKYKDTLGTLAPESYRFRPVFATPLNWYDESQSENWTHISIDRSQTPPPRAEGKLTLDPALYKWRIASDTVQPALRQEVSRATFAQMKMMPAAESREISAQPRAATFAGASGQSAPRLAASPNVAVSAMRRPVEPAVRQSVAASRMPARSSEFARVASLNVAVLDTNRVTPAPAPPPPAVAAPRMQSLLSLNASLQLANAIETDASQQAVATDQFGITVEVCMITLRRPWLSDAFLTLRGWYVPGYEKGEFADAKNEEDGPFALLPTACIVIRDLNITAQWSEEDHAAIEKSANLGGFNLFGRSFAPSSSDHNAATLTVKGMQSIAWVCEPMPLLPPASAP